ncbi:MAG: nuclear transport factor 2 family protein [Gemmataceae bacterium]
MNRTRIAVSALVVGAAVTLALTVRAQPAGTAKAASADGDRAAIEKTAREFAEAFNKGDAKAIAAMHTEAAESREVGGPTFVGRAAIEKAYTDLFKQNAGAKIEVLVQSVRFPAPDLAVEEGLLRHSRGKELPSTTAYVAIHSRVGGRWLIALTSEGGHGQNRLEDLDWLLGEWTTTVKGDAVKMAFARDPKRPVVTGTFTRTAPGKEPVGGSVRIMPDPETGQIRSWGFEDDGAHSQSLWSCDGKSWVLDQRGVLADGTPVAERVILQRVAPDVITWRTTDRQLGDEQLPDTPPMRLTRTAARK